MRIILRPGHGLTPPGPYSYCRRGNSGWHYQRPGNLEDQWTARFCSQLIPELVRRGHEVICQRAIDPVSGNLDYTPTLITPPMLPQLKESQIIASPRWHYNASVEAILRGFNGATRWSSWRRALMPSYWGWSWDPQVSVEWENAAPADLYLSIHENWWRSSKMHGFGAYHYVSSTRGKQFADRVYAVVRHEFRDHRFERHLDLPYAESRRAGSRWGIYPSKLYEVRVTKSPALLLELAFASNPEDTEDLHLDQAFSGRLAAAVAEGVTLG
jgi:hypothetical protein